MAHKEDQEALLDHDGELFTRSEDRYYRRGIYTPGHKEHFAALYITVICLTLGLFWTLAHPRIHDPTLDIYSPLNDLVEYEDVVFYDNVQHISPYQVEPPNDEVDRLWDELYSYSLYSRIDAEATKGLENNTATLLGTDGDGLVQLEVFHQLHCIDRLRKSLFPDRYPDMSIFFPNGTVNRIVRQHHLHCADRLRQNVQCSSNIGTIYFRWLEWTPFVPKPHWWLDFETVHKCRNFDKIRDWALQHRFPHFDFFTYSGTTP